jgi:NADPH:quinone reductase-like Zn-dependent oxidoreductase
VKAVLVERFGEPDTLVTRELPGPEPTHGHVVIDVAAAGVNFPDLLVIAGSYQILPPLPFSPGKEIAGLVSAVGPGAERFRVGDRVIAQVEYGGYAEQVSVPEPQVVALPDRVPFIDAAALGLGAITAHFALVRRANLQPGESVLITGPGGSVGSAGIQLAKALGAKVIVVARDQERAARARQQGADHVVYAGPAIRDDVFAVTDGRGADVVLEVAGGEMFAQALRSTAWEGRLVVIGFASGDVPLIKAGHILVKNLSVMGLQVSDYRDRLPDLVRIALEHILELYLRGRFNVTIGRTYPLDEAGQALAALKAGTVSGKIVLTCR